jgi:hypothetical protein
MSTAKRATAKRATVKRATARKAPKEEIQTIELVRWADLKKEDQRQILDGLSCRKLRTQRKKSIILPPAVPLTAKIPCMVLGMSPTAHYWMGILVGMDIFNYQLGMVSWIPNIGRHNVVLQSGKPDKNTEIEPHDPQSTTYIPRAGTVIIEWPHPLWDTTT